MIEFHDSRVDVISERDGAVVVHFKPAYVHQSEGRPGIDPGTGWNQEARLIFPKASVKGEFPEWPCDIIDGHIIVGGECHANGIPVPLDAVTFTELRLACDCVHTVTISGSGVRLELIGSPSYVDEYPREEPKEES